MCYYYGVSVSSLQTSKKLHNSYLSTNQATYPGGLKPAQPDFILNSFRKKLFITSQNALFALIFSLLKNPLLAQNTPTAPPETNQFYFWVGEWKTPDGEKKRGSNSIKKSLMVL